MKRLHLRDKLRQEIDRCELVRGRRGGVEEALLMMKLTEARHALRDNDRAAMMSAYGKLKETQGGTDGR